MNITNTPWLYPHSLERREGIDQPTRRGDSASIRAGLRALLGVETPHGEPRRDSGPRAGHSAFCDGAAAMPISGSRTSGVMPEWSTTGYVDQATEDVTAGETAQATAGAAGTVTRAGGSRSTDAGGPKPEKADTASPRIRQRTNQTPASDTATGPSRDDDGEGLGVMGLDGYQAPTCHRVCNSPLLPSPIAAHAATGAARSRGSDRGTAPATDRGERREGAWAGNTGQGGARPSHSQEAS